MLQAFHMSDASGKSILMVSTSQSNVHLLQHCVRLAVALIRGMKCFCHLCATLANNEIRTGLCLGLYKTHMKHGLCLRECDE